MTLTNSEVAALRDLLARVEGLVSAAEEDGDVALTFPPRLRERCHQALRPRRVAKPNTPTPAEHADFNPKAVLP